MPSTSTSGPHHCIRTSWASASRSWSRSSPVRSTSTTCAVRQRHPALEHLLARDVEDVGPGHLCRHAPDCCVCRVLASPRVPTAGPRGGGAVPRLRAWRAPRHGCCSSAPCSCSSRSTATRSAASWCRGGSTSGRTSTRARSTPGSRPSPAPGTWRGTRWSRATAASPSTRRPRRGAPSSSGSSPRRCACTTAARPGGSRRPCRCSPWSTARSSSACSRSGSWRSTPLLAEGEALAAAPDGVLPPHLPPLIGLWQAQARTERAWLVDTIAGVAQRHRCVRRRHRRLGAPGRRPGLGHAGRPRALPPGPRPHRLSRGRSIRPQRSSC